MTALLIAWLLGCSLACAISLRVDEGYSWGEVALLTLAGPVALAAGAFWATVRFVKRRKK